MAKLLSAKDKILIGLSLASDLDNSLKSIDGFLFHKSNYYLSVSRMLKSDLIKKIVNQKGEVYLRITTKGRENISRNFPMMSLQNKKWDGKWRIVTFDIPEKMRLKRDRFRDKLRELGFGMVQKSLFVSPHNYEEDIKEFIDSNKLSKFAFVFVAEKLLVGDLKKLVENIWQTSKVNSLYKKYCDDGKVDDYYLALIKDPFLPKELLPKNWWGFKAKSKFKTYQK